MKLSEMRQILDSGAIQLTKSLGQNFLHDQNQLRRIADAGEIKATDRVLEIGPGLGPLTELLIAEAGEVLAIEKDQRLYDFLQKRFAGEGKLTLLHEDALEYLRQKNIDTPLKRRADWSDWKLVANLPYSVASPILVELAEGHGCPERLVATLQIEVAQRIMAGSGDDDYGLLTLLLQLRYEPKGWFKIPASCFFPPPDVDSACITLVRRPEPLLDYEGAKAFTKIVKRAFSQRRKMMLKLLKQDWTAEKLTAAFESAGISPQERAENVSLEQFVQMTQTLRKQDGV
ncbi:MAG: 16S rRNA (adenine(1518)-N(6)/adenine(1519)-N(6))-dimethyltransferase RsmA [Limisphaerales bacterium]